VKSEKDFRYKVKGSFTMRNLVTLGLLALSLSFFSNPVLAGDGSDCEGLRDDPNRALYGLCIAYFNTTNALARQRIAENFVKKGGDAEEWLGIGGSDFVECTCWLQENHIEALLGGSLNGVPITYDPAQSVDFHMCNGERTGTETIWFNDGNIYLIADESGCEFRNYYGVDSVPPAEYDLFGADATEAELTCRAQIHELIQAFAGDDCL
jgi:hypothetical protein